MCLRFNRLLSAGLRLVFHVILSGGKTRINKSVIMKSLLLVLLASFGFAQTTAAQTPPYFNSDMATRENIVPFNAYSSTFQKVQDIYAPGDFAGAPAGLIDTLWVRIATATEGAGPYTDLEISMGQNIGTDATATTAFKTGLTSVFHADSFMAPAVDAGDWTAIPLTRPFPYDPALSLVVEVKSTGVSGEGLNVFRLTGANRRVFSSYAATGGTVFSGPMELGLSVTSTPSLAAPNFNRDTAAQVVSSN